MHEALVDFSQQAKAERQILNGRKSVFVGCEVVADLANIAPGAARCLVLV